MKRTRKAAHCGSWRGRRAGRRRDDIRGTECRRYMWERSHQCQWRVHFMRAKSTGGSRFGLIYLRIRELSDRFKKKRFAQERTRSQKEGTCLAPATLCQPHRANAVASLLVHIKRERPVLSTRADGWIVGGIFIINIRHARIFFLFRDLAVLCSVYSRMSCMSSTFVESSVVIQYHVVANGSNCTEVKTFMESFCKVQYVCIFFVVRNLYANHTMCIPRMHA